MDFAIWAVSGLVALALLALALRSKGVLKYVLFVFVVIVGLSAITGALKDWRFVLFSSIALAGILGVRYMRYRAKRRKDKEEKERQQFTGATINIYPPR